MELDSKHAATLLQYEFRTSGVGVRQGGRLMIGERLKGESGQEVSRNRPGHGEED